MKTGVQLNLSSNRYARYGKEKYKKIKEHGFQAVLFDISSTDNELYSISEEELRIRMLEERRQAEEAGVEFAQVHGPWRCPPMDATPEDRAERLDKMKRSIKIADWIGCKYWTIHPIMPCWVDDNITNKQKETWDLNVEFFTELLKFVKQYDITICLENLPFLDYSFAKPQDVLKFVKHFNDEQLKICLDTGHVAVFPELSVGDAVRELGDYIKVLHVHDNMGKDDQHLFPTEGIIGWPDFVKALKEVGYSGIFTLETSPGLELDDETFDKEGKRLNNIVKSLLKG